MPLHSPLHDRHVALGAKLADFGGWQMPIEYSGGGVIAEHTAVREQVGIFDVSHLGKARVRGVGAAEFVNRALTNDLARIGPGRAQYTLCCDDATGGVVDDLIAYVRSDDEVFLVPNAANTAEVVRRLAAAAPSGVSVTNEHTAYAILAVQGPRSADVLRALDVPADHDYMSFVDAGPLVVCRSGYTGERGYEIVVAASDAGPLWEAVLDIVRRFDGLPCGLGARDTLRTEMGYPLHGHELSLDSTPVQARVGWAVGWSKPTFWGREVLLKEKEAGPDRLLWGLASSDRGIPRQHMAVLADGVVVGEVTSGTFSPTRRTGIGLALLDRSVSPGADVSVDIRGRPAPMRVVKPPFVEASTR